MQELVCDKCASKIPSAAKFCPNCGDPVTEDDIVTLPISLDRVPEIKITFGYSSSRSYQTAVKVCNNVPTFSTNGEEKKAVHELKLEATDVELAIKIWELVGGWKSSSMTIDGQQITKKDLVYGGLGCFTKQQLSPRRDQYCFGLRQFSFNIWGCHRLDMPFLEWAQWLRTGSFDGTGIWHFDKSKLKQELELKIHDNKFCPLIKPEQIYATLELIPDTINPKTDPNWEYVTQREYGGDYMTYKEIAIGIKPIMEKAVSSYVVSEYIPDIPEEEDYGQSSQTRTLSIEVGEDNSPSGNSRTAIPAKSNSGCAGAALMLLLSSAVTGIFILLA